MATQKGALEKLKKLWEKCGKVYVTQPVFNRCFSTIQDWISINGLVPHMMQHELITKQKQISDITNPYHTSDDQMRSLLRHLDSCGKHAYFILYVCLYESQEDHLGHGDAVEELQKAAREMGTTAPWENPVNVPGRPIQVTNGRDQLHLTERDGLELTQLSDVERDCGSIHDQPAAHQPTPVEDKGEASNFCYYDPLKSRLVVNQEQMQATCTDDSKVDNPLMPYLTVVSESGSRGLALIINNYKFTGSENLKDRVCGPQDAENLKHTFQELGYRIRLEENKTADEIASIFESLLPPNSTTVAANTDGSVHKHDDSFVCCIVSHGYWDEARRQDFVYSSDEKPFSVQQLALEYLGVPPGSDRQNLLKQKPKLFFIHACRGKDIALVSADSNESFAQPLPMLPQVTLFPISADFLFSYPVVPGTKAFRDDHSGTFFISILCRMIDELATRLDVELILKRVHYELTSKESTAYNYKNAAGEIVRVRHCPQLISTLRGPFFLTKQAAERYSKLIE